MKILMVCLGNICRSPIAQGVMENIVKDKNLNWKIDSAGTSSFHSGNGPDPRSVEVAKKFNIDISHQRSREITKQDLVEFDHIFAMDKSNFKDIEKMCDPNQISKLKLFLEYGEVEETNEVPDPYYTHGFDYVYDLIENACYNIYTKLS